MEKRSPPPKLNLVMLVSAISPPVVAARANSNANKNSSNAILI